MRLEQTMLLLISITVAPLCLRRKGTPEGWHEEAEREASNTPVPRAKPCSSILACLPQTNFVHLAKSAAIRNTCNASIIAEWLSSPKVCIALQDVI
jgi:hypothetical protein